MYRTVSQLDTAGSTLAATHPQLCTQFTLPESSVQGRPLGWVSSHSLRFL